MRKVVAWILMLVMCIGIMPTDLGASENETALTEYNFYWNGSGKDVVSDEAVENKAIENEVSVLSEGSNSISNEGLELIKQFEGCRLTAYKALSTETYYTIGYGHYGPDVYAGMTITQEQAEELLKNDLAVFENYVNSFLDKYGITVTKNQFDALTSFTYNLGNVWVSYSTFQLKTYLINGISDYTDEQIKTAFTNWNKSGGVVIDGLTRRRNAEAELFLTGRAEVEDKWERDNDYPTPIIAYPTAISGKITVYDSGLTAYPQSTRNIAYNDLCTINAVYTNGYCNVTYPTSSGTNTEYARLSDFISNGVAPYAYTPSTNLTTYIRSDMSTAFGSVFTTDTCTVVGKIDNKIQLIYPISGGYKLGWVSTSIETKPSDFPTPLYGYNSSATERTTVYESVSTMGTYYGQIFVDDKCTLNTVNVNEGWIQVTYPVGSSTKEGYVYLDQFVPSASRLTTFYTTTITKQTTSYRKSDMGTEYGYISAGDEITVVGKTGNKLQVIYPLDSGGYKIAWIYNADVQKNLSSISVTSNPSKTSYIEGQSLNKSGLVITAKYDDGSTENVTSSCTLSGYTDTVGVKTITVSYGGKQTAFTVTVKSKCPTGIKIISNPTKTSYYVGDKIDLTGLVIQATYDNGMNENITDYYIETDEATATVGNKDIQVSYLYNDVLVFTSFNITVSEEKEDGKTDNDVVANDIPGDVNGDGDVNMKDYSLLQRYLNDWEVMINEYAADVNADGKVDMKDYSLLQRYLNGWDVELKVPSETNTPAASYTKVVYGKSELGRNLEYYCFETENYTKTILLNFAIHGFEDEYDADGQVLVDTANSLIAYYADNFDELKNTRLMIIPCANPDGLYEGTTNNGFGRCNANGVDLNRDFDANYTPFSNVRNYTPYAFSTSESRALRDVVNTVSPDIVIDFHGWLNYTIGNYELAQVFNEEMGLAHHVDFSTTNANGYFSNWAYQQGALSLLVEFSNSDTVPFGNLVNAINRLLSDDYNCIKKDTVFSRFEKINCRTLLTERVTTYKFFDEPYSSASYIDGAADEVIILGLYENGWAKVQYPVSGGNKVAYAKVSDFIPGEYRVEEIYDLELSENTVVYSRNDLSEPYGTVYPTDKCFVISDSGNALQVIYELDTGGWKMGWID